MALVAGSDALRRTAREDSRPLKRSLPIKPGSLEPRSLRCATSLAEQMGDREVRPTRGCHCVALTVFVTLPTRSPKHNTFVRLKWLHGVDLCFFEQRSIEVTGHEIRQILLLHASQLNADAMPELIAMMRHRGQGQRCHTESYPPSRSGSASKLPQAMSARWFATTR